MADDAFITFRYAENIAAGSGFVYNEGERVLGTSSPLFAFLLATLKTLRIPVTAGALGISLVCSGLTAAVVYRLAVLLRFAGLAFVPCLAYILWPRSLPADISGLETALFTLLVTAAFYFHHRRLYFYALGAATLASLTRPEGLAVLALLVLSNCIRDRANRFYYLLMPLALLIPWFAFSFFYFGTIVPHAVTAKLALYSRFGAESYWTNFVYLLALHNPVGWATAVLAAIGIYRLGRTQNFGGIEALWLALMLAFYTFSPTHLFFWYIAPIYPLFLLFAAVPVVWMFESVHGLQAARTPAVAAITLGLVVLLGYGAYRQAGQYREAQAYSDTVSKEVGRYLHSHSDRTADTLAAEDIGYIGYYADMTIIDRDGLVSPVMVSYNREGRYREAMLKLRPGWLGAAPGSPISDFLDDTLFLAAFQLDSAFSPGTSAEYRLYRRRDVDVR